MTFSLSAITDRYPSAARMHWVLAYARQSIVGFAQDFWKDGNWEKTDPLDDVDSQQPSFSDHLNNSTADFASKNAATKNTGPLWHALPGEISEKMWGNGYVTPGDEYITERLIGPLGLSKDMSLLDLSAGLGGRLRKTTDEYGVYIDGLEPDPEIAARGREMSVLSGHGKHAKIRTYDPKNLSSDHKHDCVLARETIYRIDDKEKFVKSIIQCCKAKVQVSFTDYIVNPESKNQPAILAWCAYEKGANPIGLVEMAEIWAKAGVTLRVHDDMTEYYKSEVKKGLVRFAKYIATGINPDPETMKAINKRIVTWAHRMAALEQGAKFYRFYGLK
jgi:SAM-dependent methyltransferase